MYLAESTPIYELTKKIKRSGDVVHELKGIETQSKEHFVALYLDGANRVIHKETVSIGTLNQSIVHPREVFRPAILHNSASIIVAHNHPSGTLKASDEDKEITKRLEKAGEILGIKLLDHIIITNGGFLSLKDEGFLNL